MQLNKGTILDRKKSILFIICHRYCSALGQNVSWILKYWHILIPYCNVAQRCSNNKLKIKGFPKLPLPKDFYGHAVHVILCLSFFLPSLSSSMLSSPINLQEKERHDKLTYESHSIFISPSLKDLSLSHILSLSVLQSFLMNWLSLLSSNFQQLPSWLIPTAS